MVKKIQHLEMKREEEFISFYLTQSIDVKMVVGVATI